MSHTLWLERLEEAKQRFGVETDDELAELLGVSASSICRFRSGRNELRTASKLLILEQLGVAWAAAAIGELVPAIHGAQIRKAHAAQEQRQRRVRKHRQAQGKKASTATNSGGELRAHNEGA